MTTRFATLLLGVAVLAACGGETKTKAADTAAAPPPAVTPNVTATPAPAVFRVRFETSKGPFVVEARREWSPNGVDRFYQLVSSGFFDNIRFIRVIPGFMAQFGIHGDPKVAAQWEPLSIPDDPVTHSNKRGYVTYATHGANSRTTQLFINFKDNAFLDSQGFTPIAQVVEGMPVVDGLYSGYGDGPPDGKGPDQTRVHNEGNVYLEKEFPKLDFIRSARLENVAVVDSAKKGGPAKK